MNLIYLKRNDTTKLLNIFRAEVKNDDLYQEVMSLVLKSRSREVTSIEKVVKPGNYFLEGKICKFCLSPDRIIDIHEAPIDVSRYGL